MTTFMFDNFKCPPLLPPAITNETIATAAIIIISTTTGTTATATTTIISTTNGTTATASSCFQVVSSCWKLYQVAFKLLSSCFKLYQVAFKLCPPLLPGSTCSTQELLQTYDQFHVFYSSLATFKRFCKNKATLMCFSSSWQHSRDAASICPL